MLSKQMSPKIAKASAIHAPVSDCDHITDRECARRLLDLHRDLIRYLPQEKTWVTQRDGVWIRDHRMTRMMLYAEDVVDQVYAEAASEPCKLRQKRLRDIAKIASSATGLRKMLDRASRIPEVALDVSELDSDPWLLCCRNGVVDLRNGQLREHRPDDYCARQVLIDFDPDARSEEWDGFLSETQPNRETRSFLQRAVGYSLTGSTDEEAFFLLHGPTATGKSTFLGALRCALGEYAATASFDTFLARARGGQIRNDIARLDGVRFVAASECNRGDRLDAGQVKSMTGGDAVVARFLRQEPFEFKPQCKIWMAVNDRPLVSADDDAMWRRIFEVPFTSQISEARRSGAVKNRLQDTDVVGPAILKWAVDGCLDWQDRGLDPPEEVRAATRACREQMAAVHGQVEGRQVGTSSRSIATAPSSAPMSGNARRTRRGPWEFCLSISGSLGRASDR